MYFFIPFFFRAPKTGHALVLNYNPSSAPTNTPFLRGTTNWPRRTLFLPFSLLLGTIEFDPIGINEPLEWLFYFRKKDTETDIERKKKQIRFNWFSSP